MAIASLFRTRLVRAASAFLVALGTVVLIPGGDAAEATGDPNVSLAKSVPAEALAGDTAILVTLTATNTSGTDGYNLTFVDTLQPGVSFVSSDPAPSQILTDTPHTGETTLVWRNVADLQAGVSQSLDYTISAGSLPVGTQISNTRAGHNHFAGAYVNSNARVVPTYNTGTNDVDNETGWDTASGTTLLVPFILEKLEPNTESELLRGLHDHQTVYTLEISNNHLGATSDFAIEDWIPAGMEFLGCGTEDNSTVGEEYPGSGAINPGNAPALANPCITPTTVETIDTDPPGPLPSGIYTHVVWDVAALGTSLNASEVARFDYVAAIPMYANTLTWAAGEPTDDGPQGSNIDNNSGASTEETSSEIEMTNTAVAFGTYSGTAYSDQTEMSVSAEDLSIHKDSDHEVITHGADTVWTLTVETSEYVGAASSLVVEDTVPDGLCPHTSCGASSNGTPPYNFAFENTDGTWTLRWNLADMAANETVVITFPTTTLSNYRENSLDDTPVLANDSWINNVRIDGTVDGRSVEDLSWADQSAGPVAISKEVADRVDPLTTCGDGSTLAWNADLANDFHIGDQVCWRLVVDYPTNLDTFDSDIQDYLPPGHEYTAADSWALGENNTVPSGDITGPTVADYGDTVLTWTVGDGGGYVSENLYLEVVFSSTIVDPDPTISGDLTENLMKYSWENTAGTPFNLRDLANVEVLEAELDLVKGVFDVDGTPTGGNNVDGVEVSELDVITYGLTITNTGDIDANDVEVWDLLPPEYDACGSNVNTISDGGTCATGTRIEWTGLTVPANGSIQLTYIVAFPSGIAPNETIPNDAGVRSYTSQTNNGTGTFTYYPESNVDPGAPAPNTTTADDPSSVVTPDVSISKNRTTSIDESGNALADQATIGETITYTIVATIPEGTTVDNYQIVDDLPVGLDLVLPATVTFDGVGGDAEVTSLPSVDPGDGSDILTVSLNDTNYTNPVGSGDDTLTVVFDATVLDVPQNAHGDTIGNTAILSWDNQDGAGFSRNASVNTSVVEPNIGVAKTSVDGIGNDGYVVGGETVDYTLTISNSSGASMAHDIVVVDTLPVGITPTLPIADGGVWASGPRTVTWNIAALNSNSSVQRTYTVTVDDPIVVSTTLTNNVVVDTTSMAGTPAGERTAGTRYTDTDSDTQNSPLASITKAVSPGTATIGDVVTYTIDVTIPSGTIMYDATVIDTFPSELVYDGMTSSSCDMGGSACSPDITVTDIGTVGSQSVGFWLGDIVPSAATARVVTITYDAHVNGGANRGDTPDNAATIWGNQTDKITSDPNSPPDTSGFDVSTGPATDSFLVVEPALTIDKHVSGQNADDDWRRALPGDTLIYTVTVTNDGDTNLSDAHDLTVVDSLTDLTYITVSNISDGGVWDAGTDTITWTLAGPLTVPPDPDSSVALTYEVTIAGGLGVGVEDPLGAELINTADVPSYFGVPSAFRSANPTYTFIDYDDVDDDTVEVELDLASIGDYVWFDVDNDGVQDPGELPLAGVGVTVTYHGADGVFGTGDDESHVVTTNASGLYLADELPGGQYTVVVDDTDLPAGLMPSYNLDGTLDHTWSGALAENEDKDDVDFGYTGNGTIGDTVWFDMDLDGTINGSEVGIAGVDVDVTFLGWDGVPGGGDDVVYSATTDANGTYSVPNLPAGAYVVDVDTGTLPTGMVATHDADGGDDNTSALTLGASENNNLQDFGYAGSGEIGDYVWLDTDGDGNQDAGEPGLMGVTLQLTWPGEDGVLGGGDDHLFLTTTDGSGAYLFDNLPPGEYQVDVLGSLPSAADNTFDEDGNNDSSMVVNLGDGDSHLTTDFGYQGTASIGDTIWWDLDGDGALDAGEPGIPGVEVTLVYAGLDGVLGNADDLTFTQLTDINGNYQFEDLPEGNYSVTVTDNVPAGFVPTFDEDGGTDETSLVTGLTALDLHLTADFGYTGTGTIGDFVFLDANSDGIDDPGEPGVPGVDVDLTWYGVDGLLGTADDVVLSTTTDASGFYSFTDLPEGDYDVAVQPGTLPPGLSPTGDADGLGSPHVSSLTLGAGATDLDQDFGYSGGSSIGDTIWFDRNSDGIIDPDEFGLEGVEVWVTWAGPDGILGNGDDEDFGAITDGNGTYLVTNLPPGEYGVWVDSGTLPPGFTATYDEDGTLDDWTGFTLADGESHLTADFGYTGSGELGDLVWFDLNGDGVADPGEPGIPDQTVAVTWAGPDGVLGTGDDQVYMTVTDSSGGYLFENLPPGDYDVSVLGPIATAAVNTSDEDGDNDSHTSVALGDGASHLTADFGYAGNAEIGDLVWLDFDGDGVADPGEPGLAGVEVTITWYGGDGVPGGGDDIVLPPYTTDASGNYLATGLPDGSYGVEVTSGVPAGLINSGDEDGDLDEQTDVAGLTAGDSHLTADFGYAGTGEIGDTIWWDLDGDQTQGPDEPGLAGIDVTLTWAGLNGIFGDADDAVFTTTTDADGMYLFDNLPPGGYVVAVDETGLPAGVVQSADPDGTLDGESAVTLGLGESNLNQDFGYRGEGSVGDLVWYDIDNDGTADAGEPGLAGVTVTVTFFGPDGVAGGGDDVVVVRVTDANGNYTVPGLPSGFYSAEIDLSTVPVGLTVTSDLDGGDPAITLFALGAAEDKSDVDYPVIGDASLSGTVWNDVDGDQEIDAGEAGIPDVTVIVTWDGPAGPVVIEVVSGPDGSWSLPVLPPGDYTVELDPTTVPDGMSPTTPVDAAVTLPVGGHEVVDFGLAEFVNLGSTVWVDTDGDGVVDANEQGIADVLVNLYDENGVLVAIAETDADGNYLFTDLPPGTYLVQLDPDSLSEELLATFDRDGSPDLNTLVNLSSGLSILDANFGFQVSGDDDDLPDTGFETQSFLILGAMLTLLGAVLVTTSRARKRYLSIPASGGRNRRA